MLNYLECVDVRGGDTQAGFVLPLQRVCRPDASFRGFQGQVEAGRVRVGDALNALPSMERARIVRIIEDDRDADWAKAGRAVTLTLTREIDISRGCVLVRNAKVAVSDRFTAADPLDG